VGAFKAKGRVQDDSAMKLGIMQPYFLPYIGYWQLLAAVDKFVIYDNIQYTKKGWINRNRFLQNGKDVLFTIPLKKDSDFLDVVGRSVAENYDRSKLLNQFEASYRKAPFFGEVFPVITSIVKAGHQNLFDYILNSIKHVADFLEIKTLIEISSSIPMDHTLRGEQKVMGICRAIGATRYINPSGGQDLYSKEVFAGLGIELQFIITRPICYRQFGEAFVPNLSIVDVMMFNSRESIHAMLCEYDLK
jgi:hypothetical protein